MHALRTKHVVQNFEIFNETFSCSYKILRYLKGALVPGILYTCHNH